MNRILTIIICLFISPFVYGQMEVPRVSGNVRISMKYGLIASNLRVTNLPRLDTAFRILLHRGLKIKAISDTVGALKYTGYNNGDMHGEGIEYRPYRGNAYLPLPNVLRISYTGAYPVYKDTLNTFDNKGLIAFNGKTLRATEQSKWYPIIYDSKNDRELTSVTYDIKVDCEDCKTLYLNGSPAVSGPQATFRSNLPLDLILFTGDYEVKDLANIAFLNATIPATKGAIFEKEVAGIKAFLQSKLRIPYKEKITFLQHNAITPYGPDESWGFVSFPTVAIAGARFENQVNLEKKQFGNTLTYKFYAHELSHYYFGTLIIPNSTLQWFFLESVPDYLALKATIGRYGNSTMDKFRQTMASQTKDHKVVPLAEVKKPEQIDDFYRYTYGPLILLAMDKRFGEKKIFQFLTKVIQHPEAKFDYHFLCKEIYESGISSKDWSAFENDILKQENAESILSAF